MAKQTINLGTSANSGGGDPLRNALQKVNDNFDEVYTKLEALEDGQVITDVQGSVFADDSTLLVDSINNSINLDGTVKGDIIPDTDVAYDIGSATNRFRDLYLSGSTIDLGGTTLSVAGGVLQVGGVGFNELVNSTLADNRGFSASQDDGNGGTIAGAVGVRSTEVELFQSIDPAGPDNELRATLRLTNGEATLESTIQTLDGNNDPYTLFTTLQTSPGTLNIQVDGGSGTSDFTFDNSGLTLSKILSPATGNLDLEVGREAGGTFNVTAWADKSDPGNGWKQIVWGYDTDRYSFFVGGDIDAQGSINGTLTGNVAKVNEAFAVSVDVTGADPTPYVWGFTNTYGSGTSLTIPRADAGFVLTEAYGIATSTIQGPGIGDGVSAYAVSVDIDSDPNNIILTVIDPETESFANDVAYVLTIAETITTVSNLLTFDLAGQLAVNGNIAGDNVIAGGQVKVGPAGDYAPSLYTTVSEQNGIAMDLHIDAGIDGGVTGNVTIAGDSIELLGFVNADAIDIGATRIREEFIEFQGASQLSIPLDGWRSQFAIDIVNKEVVVTSAESGSGQDVLIVQPGSVIFTTDYYFIDGSTYYQVTGVTDLGGGLTQLDIPGYDFTSLIGIDPVELFDSATNTDPHEIRIDSAGDATGIRSLTGVAEIVTPVNGDLYIVSANEGGTVTNVLYNTNPTYGAYESHLGTVDFTSANRVLGPDKTPASSVGAVGDKAKEIAFDANYIYYCTADYDGVTNIWKRVAWSGDTW